MSHHPSAQRNRAFQAIIPASLSLILLGFVSCQSTPQSPRAPEKPAFEAHRNLDYMPGEEYADGKDLLDVFSPPGAQGAPVMIFLHGGGLVDGDKEFSNYDRPGAAVTPDFVPTRFVPEGIVVVLANYRLSPSVMHPEHARDAAAIVRWVRENISQYGGDPEKIFLSGHSAGAYLSALLAVDESYLQEVGLSTKALAGVIPVSAFINVPEVAPDRDKSIWGESKEVWEQASVDSYLGPDRPAMFLIFADGDDAWRRDQNRRFQEQLLDAGNPVVELREISDRIHISIWSRIMEEGDQTSQAIVDFIRRLE